MTTDNAQTKDHAKTGLAAVIGAIVVWSFVGIIIKLSSVSALTFASWRLWIGAGALWIVGALQRKPLSRRVLKMAVPGGILFAVNMFAHFAALKLSTVANVQLILAIQPAIVLVVAGPLLGERVGLRKAGWTAMSVLGIGVVVLGAPHGPAWRPGGDILAVVALVSWTAFVIITKQVRATVDALEYMSGVVLVAAVALSPMMIAFGHGETPRGMDWLLIAAVVFGPGTGGHLLMSWALRYVDVTISSLIAVAQPILASIAAFAILGEAISVIQVIGGSIAIMSVAIVVMGARRDGSDQVQEIPRDVVADTLGNA